MVKCDTSLLQKGPESTVISTMYNVGTADKGLLLVAAGKPEMQACFQVFISDSNPNPNIC